MRSTIADIRILLKNTMSLLMREFINKGALLIMLFFIGRLLGKAQLGQYTLALVISQILFLATDLGLNILLIREVSKDKSNASKYLFNFGVINFILSSLTLVLAGLVVVVLNCPKEVALVIYLCAFSYFLVRLIVLFESVFQAFEKMEYQLFGSLFKNIIFISLGIWYLYNGGGLIGLFCIFFIANALTLAIMGFFCMKMIGFKYPSLEIDALREYIIKTIPLWLTQLFAVLYLKIATLFLYRINGDEAVGIYNAAYVIVDGFIVLSGAIATAFFPLFSRLHRSSENDFKAVYEKSLSLVVFLFLPAAVLIALLSNRIALLLYGPGFESTALVMRFLSCTAFLVVFGSLNTYVMVTLDKQKVLPFICGFGVLLNVALNLSLIPRLNYIGAAISSILTEFIMFSTLMFVVIKCLGGFSLARVFLKTIIAAFVTGVFVYSFRHANIFVVVGLAILLYLAVTYFLKGFIFRERGYLKRILSAS